MSLTQFPEPADLNVGFVERTGDSRPLNFQQYTVANPHPGFGKDPNILNEFGHTKYPMWVGPVIVNNEAEEKEARNPTPVEPKKEVLKTDGPTVEEYVKAGYKASEYPPAGYESKSTKEEIAELAKLETANPWLTK